MINWNQILRPRSWDDIMAQTKIKNLLISSLENDNLGQFIIFSGPSGIGKSCIAELIGSAIACDNNKIEPCGKCKNCRDLQQGSQAVVKKFNMAMMIAKQDILSIVNEIFNYDTITGKAVFILEEIDALSEQNQRPFLEPLTQIPEDVCIIMCTAHIGNVIPELRNRAINYKLEIPNVTECVKFIKNICSKMGLNNLSDNTAKMLAEMCNCIPRTIIATLQMFANEKVITTTALTEYFGIADINKYILLMKYLNRNVSDVEYVKFLGSLSECNVDAKKLVKGIERFIVLLLLERSQPKPFKDYSPEQQESLRDILTRISPEDVLKLAEQITSIPNRAYTDETSATMFLITLKLCLTDRDHKIIQDSPALARQTVINSNTVCREKTINNDRRAINMKKMNSSDLKLITGEVYSD